MIFSCQVFCWAESPIDVFRSSMAHLDIIGQRAFFAGAAQQKQSDHAGGSMPIAWHGFTELSTKI